LSQREDLPSIGSQIAERRKTLKLSQAELARKAGVSRATLEALENGRAGELGFSKLAKLLAAVGLEIKLQPAGSHRPTLDELMQEDRDDKVWTDAAESGLLDRHGERGSTFV
jgi:transcriptional regulator with XRE-family HTH domain